MKNGELIGEMIAWEAGEPKRINHFLKVYGFAKAIASREQLSSATMNLVETAAILHDIGIRPALEKHGSSAGALQEEEGETESFIKNWTEKLRLSGSGICKPYLLAGGPSSQL